METFYTNERQKWRDFLTKNFEIKEEIWFVFPMKESVYKKFF